MRRFDLTVAAEPFAPKVTGTHPALQAKNTSNRLAGYRHRGQQTGFDSTKPQATATEDGQFAPNTKKLRLSVSGQVPV